MSAAILRDFKNYIPTPSELRRFREILVDLRDKQAGRLDSASTRPSESLNALNYALARLDEDQPFVDGHAEDARCQPETAGAPA